MTGSSRIIAGVSVGVSFFIIMLAIAISDGFKREIRDKATGFTGEITLTAPGFQLSGSQYPVEKRPPFLDSISSISQVVSVHPYAYRSALLKNGDLIHGVLLKGVDSMYNWDFFKKVLCDGSLPNVTGKSINKEVLVSKRLASMMGYESGDTITLYSIGDNIRIRRMVVSGLYDAQLEDIDETLVVCALNEVQRLNDWTAQEVSGLEVNVGNYRDIEKVIDKVESIIYFSSSDNRVTYSVSSITDLFPHLFDWLRLLDFNVVVVLALMMCVAGFNMISGLLIMLFEKSSVIGLLKALGMRNRKIHMVFLCRAMGVVFMGMIAGNIAAVIVAYIQQRFGIITLDPANYFVKFVPIYFDWSKVVLINFISLAGIVVFMLTTSIFISKLSPDKSLRIK